MPERQTDHEPIGIPGRGPKEPMGAWTDQPERQTVTECYPGWAEIRHLRRLSDGAPHESLSREYLSGSIAEQANRLEQILLSTQVEHNTKQTPERQTVTVDGVTFIRYGKDDWLDGDVVVHPDTRHALNALLASEQRREQAEADVRWLLRWGTDSAQRAAMESHREIMAVLRGRYPKEEGA
jgi:hypothetical protein